MLRATSKAAFISLAVVMLAPGPLTAAIVPDLYVAQVPARALSGPPLDEAFAQALDLVLVKVTGQRGIAADAARRRAVGPPAPLVRQYQPMPGGEVRVSFDPAALRRRLDAANLPVWADDRPVTLVSLPPEAASSGPAPAEASPVRSYRQIVEATAEARGVPVVFAPDASADLNLAGTLSPSAGPAMLRWTLAGGADRAEWQGDPVEGTHALADRLAARYATAASGGRVLRVRIVGVDSFDAYGRLQGYLRSMGVVQSAELREINAGQLVYDLTVRGDIRQLNDALALRRTLEPASEPGAGELVYRLVHGVSAGGTAGP